MIAEAKLANAAPALKAAEDALQTIKSAHIATGKLYAITILSLFFYFDFNF